MAEQAYVLAGDGTVIPHGLPLPPGIADRIAHGELKLVNADGSDIADRATKNRRSIKEVATGE